jgi:hypothetical protein
MRKSNFFLALMLAKGMTALVTPLFPPPISGDLGHRI